ncbi:DUF4142 domain-containing protein [Hymenobacter sp. AT01-02]|uniref:DUF4142 domain-containing protein n=1 Tax=Hymenobacter sp. AT01-02 TaxID=1571877 RepID=UPI0006965ED8|nr:DUF4142 domain-containing protein [Hymenobacter sp. AT01-02]
MTLFRRFSAVTLLPLLVACSGGESNKDPVAEAKFKNESRISNEAVTKKQEQDAEYVVNSANRNMFIQEISQVAQRKSTSANVKYLAQSLIAQHTTAQTALQTLAAQKSLILPKGLGGDQADQVGELVALTGAAFDKKYAELLVRTHKMAIEAADDMREEAYDGDIRTFADQQVSTLKQHLEAAEQLEDQLDK